MHGIETVLALLVVVTALATIARRSALPYPIVLVVGGLLLGFVPGLPEVRRGSAHFPRGPGIVLPGWAIGKLVAGRGATPGVISNAVATSRGRSRRWQS